MTIGTNMAHSLRLMRQDFLALQRCTKAMAKRAGSLSVIAAREKRWSRTDHFRGAQREVLEAVTSLTQTINHLNEASGCLRKAGRSKP